MFIYDVENKMWECEKPGGFLPAPRSFFASASVDNKFYVFGGQGKHLILTNIKIFQVKMTSFLVAFISLPTANGRKSNRMENRSIRGDKQRWSSTMGCCTSLVEQTNSIQVRYSIKYLFYEHFLRARNRQRSQGVLESRICRRRGRWRECVA